MRGALVQTAGAWSSSKVKMPIFKNSMPKPKTL